MARLDIQSKVTSAPHNSFRHNSLLFNIGLEWCQAH